MLTPEQEALFARHVPVALYVTGKMWRTFRRFMAREDVLQEALLALAYAAKKYDKEVGSFAGYAATAVRRRLISAARTLSGYRCGGYREPQRYGLFIDVHDTRSPVSSLDDADEVESLLSKVSQRQAACLRLRVMEGLTFDEAGRRLGVSGSLVCKETQAGLRELLALVESDDIVEGKEMTTITVNGASVSVPDGASVSVRGGVVYVNGKPWDCGKVEGEVTLKVEGGLINLTVERGNVHCGAVAGDVDAGGSVTCHNVGDGVDAGGSVIRKGGKS